MDASLKLGFRIAAGVLTLAFAMLVGIGAGFDAMETRLQGAILSARSASKRDVADLRTEFRTDRDQIIERLNQFDRRITEANATLADRISTNDRAVLMVACHIGNPRLCPTGGRWDRPPGPGPLLEPREMLR